MGGLFQNESIIQTLEVMAVILSATTTSLTVFFFLAPPVLLGLILYYFTGKEKKAEKFMPNLMAQSLRIFNYIWMFIVSIGAFIAANMFLAPILEFIMPDPEFSGIETDEFDDQTLVRGIITLLLVVIFGLLSILFNRKVYEVSKVPGTISTKLFITSGLIFFSIPAFIFTVNTFNNIVDYIYNQDGGVSGTYISLMFTSIAATMVFIAKAMQILKRESK